MSADVAVQHPQQYAPPIAVLTGGLTDAASHLPVLALRFRLRVDSVQALPSELGSTLHGLLGWAAAEVHPSWRALLFPVQSGLGSRDSPNPFVISIDRYDPERRLIDLDWTLFGPAAGEAQAVMQTMAVASQMGLGSSRTHFAVEWVDQRLADGRWNRLTDGGPQMQIPVPMRLSEPLMAAPLAIGERADNASPIWELHLRSPLVLVHQGSQITRAPDPDVLTARLLARLQMLLTEMGPGPGIPSELRAHWIRVMRGRLVGDNTHPYGVDRFARSEGRRRHFSGLAGAFRYQGLTPAAPVLWRLADWIRVGKKTSYGFGLIEAIKVKSHGD